VPASAAPASPGASLASVGLGGSTPEPLIPSVSPSAPAIRDWVVGWSPDASALAVWTSTGTAAEVGSLALYAIDPDTGTIDRQTTLLAPVTARRVFSIAEDRLAWTATPDSMGRTELHVVVWGTFGRGEIRSRGLLQQELIPAF
jgi:hypothetical protein